MTAIKLNSTNAQSRKMAVPISSILTCVSVSNPTVYVGGIVQVGAVHDLSAGDSMYVPVGTLTLYLFKKSHDDLPFSAELDLSIAPVAKPTGGTAQVDTVVPGALIEAPAAVSGTTATGRPARGGAKTGGTKD